MLTLTENEKELLIAFVSLASSVIAIAGFNSFICRRSKPFMKRIDVNDLF